MRAGQIDAISNLDPVITILQRSGDIRIVSDTREVAEADKVFGGPMPAACLYAPQPFLDRNPNVAQALTNAIVRANKWIQQAGPSDIIKVVPEGFLLGDRAIYIDAFLKAKGALSPAACSRRPAAPPRCAHSPAWMKRCRRPSWI